MLALMLMMGETKVDAKKKTFFPSPCLPGGLGGTRKVVA
jgi:hypothetical protein